MKIFKYIYTIAFAMLALCSCAHNDVLGNEDINIPIPENGYIFFDTGVGSRGSLVHGTELNADFSVLGYKYIEDSWYDIESMASQASSSTYKVFNHAPLFVDNENGYDDFDNDDKSLVEWENKKYTFFAWYPVITDANKAYLSWSSRNSTGTIVEGNVKEGTPYITYTLDRNDATKHIDVMTASKVNHRVGNSNKNVTLTMQHRLSALEIVARSYVNAAALELTGTTANVVINSLSITLDGLLNDKAEIPLNTDNNEKNTHHTISYNSANNTIASFDILANSSKKLNYYNSVDDVAKLTSDANKTMILIPQESALDCTVTITFDIVDGNGGSLWNTIYPNVTDRPSKTQVVEGVKINKLQENFYYEILLNFTKSGVTVNVQEAEAWGDIDINHEFE